MEAVKIFGSQSIVASIDVKKMFLVNINFFLFQDLIKRI